MNKRLFLKVILNLVFLSFFIYIMTKVDFKLFKEMSSKVSPLIWLLIFLLFALLYLFKALRIKILNSEFQVKKTYIITAYHNFFLMLLPLKLGELAYIKKLKEENITVTKSLSDVILFRIYDLFLVGLFSMAILLFSNVVGKGYSILFLSIFLVACLTFIIYPSLFYKLIPSNQKSNLLKKTATKLKDVIGSNNLPVSKKTSLFIYTLFIWLISFSIWVVLLTQITEAELLSAFLASIISTITTFLPINLPANIGLTQGGWMLGFYVANLPLDIGLAFSVFANAVYVIYTTLIFFISKLFIGNN